MAEQKHTTLVTDEQVTRAVAAWDEARCAMHEKWHGGKCQPCSEAHRKNVEPMMRPVLEDFVANLHRATSTDIDPNSVPTQGPDRVGGGA